MKIFLVVLLVGFIAAAPADNKDDTPVPGGLSGPKEEPATTEVKDMVKELEPEIRNQIIKLNGNKTPQGPIEAVSFKSQVVAGTNYFIKVKVDNAFYFVRIHENLEDKRFLDGVVGPKGKDDQVEYFEN